MLLVKLLSIMDNLILVVSGFFGGAIVAIVALALVRGDKNENIEVDPEKEEAAKQWNQQSKGYN
jgi:hypothetical protein